MNRGLITVLLAAAMSAAGLTCASTALAAGQTCATLSEASFAQTKIISTDAVRVPTN